MCVFHQGEINFIFVLLPMYYCPCRHLKRFPFHKRLFSTSWNELGRMTQLLCHEPSRLDSGSITGKNQNHGGSSLPSYIIWYSSSINAY